LFGTHGDDVDLDGGAGVEDFFRRCCGCCNCRKHVVNAKGGEHDFNLSNVRCLRIDTGLVVVIIIAIVNVDVFETSSTVRSTKDNRFLFRGRPRTDQVEDDRCRESCCSVISLVFGPNH
jgi:hypothetical protein